MAFPTLVGSGSTNNGTGAISLSPHASTTTDDIMIALIETANEAIVVPGGGWAHVTGSPQGTGTAADAAATRLTMIWKRAGASEGAISIADSGDHNYGRILTFRGCITTGDPWNVTSSGVDAVSDTSLNATGATTTVADCLVLIAATTATDNTVLYNATSTNADLANLTTQFNTATASGNGGSILVVTGEKASAGAYGDTTNTLSGSSLKAWMTVALKPPVVAPPGTMSNLTIMGIS